MKGKIIFLKTIGVSILILFLIGEARAESVDFFEVPAKSIRFIDRVTQDSLGVEAYTLSFDSKFNCLDADCKVSSGKNHSSNEVKMRGESIQTFATQIPKMPKSSPLILTFRIAGVCRQSEKCQQAMSLEQFAATAEPVIISFDYDVDASKNKRLKRQEASLKSRAEIEAKMGKAIPERKPAEEFDWKKIELEFTENRKKSIPMVYSENAILKLNAAPFFCGKDLQSKINSCSFYSCLYRMDVMGDKLASDIIVHGINGAGLCAISGPVGKRYFVAKDDLSFFYDVLIASSSPSEVTSSAPLVVDPNQTQKTKNTLQLSGSACVINLETKKEQLTSASLDASAPSLCKDKKVDLLYQLELKKLSLNFTPIKMGFLKDDF